MTTKTATKAKLTKAPPDNDPPPTDPLKFPTVRPDAPEVGEPPEPMPEDEETEQATPKRGERTLVYRGNADVFRYGALRIRPGEPFVVTASQAEDLLTWPRERFEEVSQE